MLSELALRLGLGIMYLYSGFDLLFEPEHWYGFLPYWFSDFISRFVDTFTYIRLQGGVEIAFGIVFIAWFLPRKAVKISALLAALEMASILVFVGVDHITFRDIGLLGAGLSLFLWQTQAKL